MTTHRQIRISGKISGRPSQRGVSVIAAVFLLLLMAVLAAAITNIVSTAHLNQAADIGGTRAYQAARAGVEWGMYQLDPNAQVATLPPCFPDAVPPVPGHAMEVRCQSWDATEGARQLRIYRIISRAVAVGVKSPGIERQVEVTVEKCRDATIAVAPFDC